VFVERVERTQMWMQPLDAGGWRKKNVLNKTNQGHKKFKETKKKCITETKMRI